MVSINTAKTALRVPNCLSVVTIFTETGGLVTYSCMIGVSTKLSHDMRFPTMWYVRPAKPQTSMRIRAV